MPKAAELVERAVNIPGHFLSKHTETEPLKGVRQ